MKNLYFVSIALFVLVATGCDISNVTIHVGGDVVKGSGILLEEKRSLPEFTDIDLAGAYDVVVMCGQKEDVMVAGDDNIVPHVKTKVDGNVLKVSLDQSVSTKNKIKLTLSENTINSLAVSGAANVSISRVNNKSFKLNISGTGNVKVQGLSEVLQITLSGAGDVDARNLSVQTASVDVSGTGNVSLSASDEVSARISGVGNVDYYGDPKKVHESISGIGRMRKR